MPFLKNGSLFTPRTELTFPGVTKGEDTLKIYRSFLKSDADHGMADMEDACPHDFKGEPVRKNIVRAFNELNFKDKVITFRPNNWQTEWHEEDLEFVISQAVDKFDGIILPKIFEPKNLEYSLTIIKRAAEKNGWSYLPQVEILIENPSALVHIKELCEVGTKDFAQKDKKTGMLVGLIFGIADYAAANSQPDALLNQNYNFLVAKQTVINTAHAYGLHAIDNVWLKLAEKEPERENWLKEHREEILKSTRESFESARKGLLFKEIPGEVQEQLIRQAETFAFECALDECKRKNLENEDRLYQKNNEVSLWGMDGTWVIHPSQIEVAHRAFTPTKDLVKKAEALVEEYFAAGGGSLVSKAGGSVEMADTATMNIALTQLGRAANAGLYEQGKVRGFQLKAKDVIGFSYR